MNTYVDLRTFEYTSYSVFKKIKNKTQITLKPNIFLKIANTNCRQCHDVDMCQNSVKNINVW